VPLGSPPVSLLGFNPNSLSNAPISLGLSWDSNVDMDAAFVGFAADGAVVDAVFYTQTSAFSGAVTLSGDKDDGGFEGTKDETITTNLPALPDAVRFCALVVSTFTGSFSDVESAFAQLRQNGEVVLDESIGIHGDFTSSVVLLLHKDDNAAWSVTLVNSASSGRHFQDATVEANLRKAIKLVAPSTAFPAVAHPDGLNNGKVFNMDKGDHFRITGDQIRVGLGWDAALPGTNLNAGAALFNARGRRVGLVCLATGNVNDGGVRHLGNNKTGAGDGDESMVISSSEIPDAVASIYIVVSMFSAVCSCMPWPVSSLSTVPRAHVRIFNQTSDAVGDDLARYDLVRLPPSNTLVIAGLKKTGEGKGSGTWWLSGTLPASYAARMTLIASSMD